MTSSQYNEKMNTLINDKISYLEIDYDPIANLRKNSYEISKIWNNKKYFSKVYHDYSLTQTNSTIALIYGLPKLHKNGIPLRPVVPYIGTPTYLFASEVNNLFKLALEVPESHINNSIDLLDKIKDVNIPSDHILISLDVKALYPNVSLDLIKKSIRKRFHLFKKINNKILLREIIEAVEFLYENTYFMFNGRFFKQTYGTPMGSPISPILADIVMADLEESCIKKLKYKPLFFVRYVDDILTCIPKDQIDNTLKVFNNYHERLQFTYEIENNNKINFLELTLIKNNNTLMHNWYRKNTSSDRFLNYKSNHTKSQKIGMVYTLVDKVFKLSHKSFHKENLIKIKNYLIKNNYPIKFIDYYSKKKIRLSTL